MVCARSGRPEMRTCSGRVSDKLIAEGPGLEVAGLQQENDEENDEVNFAARRAGLVQFFSI